MVSANEYIPLVISIKELMKRDWSINITHVYREVNFTADFLANYALSLPLGCHHFNVPPISLLPFLTHDMYGVAYPRFVCP